MARNGQSSAMDRVVAQFSRLPGIGKRSAQRLAFYLLKQPASDAYDLATAITDLKRNTQHCSVCFNLTESDPCPICVDPNRDHGLILVVEQPNDVALFESAGGFKGVYHVLMGRLSPLDGIGSGELNIGALLDRITPGDPAEAPRRVDPQPPPRGQSPTREVILGLSPTLEGDGTALYLTQQLAATGVAVTRLARGLPTGSNLELVSKAVLSDSIHGRRPMKFD